VTIDVPTTERKVLTPTQRLKLFEQHRGVCGICGVYIRAGDRWIAEHLTPLALGGTNDLSNLAPVHEKCAALKTKDDMKRAAKAKAQKRAHLGIKPQGPRIVSQGFPKREKPQRFVKTPLPPKRIYE
jgi:5-methylcytosine-specific restriction endonuclease McrA